MKNRRIFNFEWDVFLLIIDCLKIFPYLFLSLIKKWTIIHFNVQNDTIVWGKCFNCCLQYFKLFTAHVWERILGQYTLIWNLNEFPLKMMSSRAPHAPYSSNNLSAFLSTNDDVYKKNLFHFTFNFWIPIF